jgi:hypothetical protein
MAKKRATKKPAMNQPPIGDDAEWVRQMNRRQNLQNTLMANRQAGIRPGESLPLSRDARAERAMKIRAINAGERAYVKNQAKYPSPGVTAMGKAPDKISGRTTDAGTRSILDGMKNFMKSGTRGAFRGGIRGGGGGRPGTRL